MEDFLASLSQQERITVTTIADYAAHMGYRAKKDKTSSLGYTFSHAKVKQTILRFSTIRSKPILRLKYFASPAYSSFFHEAIRLTIEEYQYRYTGCYGCGKCDGTWGYTYHYPDGRSYFRCGTELIEFFEIQKIPLHEFLLLFKNQHNFFLTGNTFTNI